METPKLTKLDQLKAKFEENKVPIVAGAGFVAGIAATLYCVKFSDYDPEQPIPDLLLTEGFIKRNLGASILAVDFLRLKGLEDEFSEFAKEMTKTALDARTQV